MNTAYVLNYFKERLLSLEEDFPLIRNDNVSLPCDTFDKRGKNFWIDLFFIIKEKYSITDAEELQRIQIVYKINVMRNSGYTVLAEAADRITDLWSDRISAKAGFSYNNMQIFIRKIELDSINVSKDISAVEIIIDTDCIYSL